MYGEEILLYSDGEEILLYSVPKAESFYSRNMFCRFEDYMKPASDWFTSECIPMFMTL